MFVKPIAVGRTSTQGKPGMVEYLRIQRLVFFSLFPALITSPSVLAVGWLWLVGSIKLQVSFAKETYKRNYTLQKRPIILSILLTAATPYQSLPHIIPSPHSASRTPRELANTGVIQDTVFDIHIDVWGGYDKCAP